MDLRTYLFGNTTRQMVYKSLDAGSLRGRAISENLANISTPGYKRKEVNFEDQLQQIMKIKLKGVTTDENHMEISQRALVKKIEPEVFVPDEPTLPGEINNVDVDIEASKMAENQILYNYAIKFASFDGINSTIIGRANS